MLARCSTIRASCFQSGVSCVVNSETNIKSLVMSGFKSYFLFGWSILVEQVKEDVRAGVLGLIEKEREGEVVDRELLKSVINVRLECLNVSFPVSHSVMSLSIGVCGNWRLETIVSYSSW